MSAAEPIALDTSCAVPLLSRTHPAHATVRRAIGSRLPVLTGHSLVETYSVLTRLSGDARLAPLDAARLLTSQFGPTALVDDEITRSLVSILSRAGLAGGAVYDALVGLATVSNDITLLTRDGRAMGTYAAVGARIELVRP